MWNFSPVQKPDSFKRLGENSDSAHDSGDILATGGGRPRGHHGNCGTFQMNLLGMDVLRGKQWCDTRGNSWSFSAHQIRQLAKTPSAEVRLLQAAPALPPSKLTNVKPCPLPLGARAVTAPVLAELRDQGVVVPTHSSYNSPAWPVQKPKGEWWLTVE